MIRFQVMNHQVIRFAASKSGIQIGEPFANLVSIHRVGHGNLFVNDDIRIVGHAFGHNILALEQIDIAIVNANVLDISTKILHDFSFLLTAPI